MPSSRAALFDMDRTLVTEHTSRLFTRYRRDLGEQGLRDALRVSWWILLYTLGVVDAPRIARAALAEFRGTSEEDMRRRCAAWFPRYVVPYISERGRAVVESHRRAGDLLVIVTGATCYGAELLGRELGIEHVVCSRVEVDAQGRFTGEVEEPLCLGAGKVERAARFLSQQGLSLADAVFYTDSMTDEPLLSAVGEQRVVNPDFRLRRLARRSGWPILAW